MDYASPNVIILQHSNQPGSCQEVAPDLTREVPVHPTNTWLPQLAQKSGRGLVLDGDFGKKDNAVMVASNWMILDDIIVLIFS